MATFGDISGILHNVRTNNIFGGNQRAKILGLKEPTITKTYDPPTELGTVSEGFIEHNTCCACNQELLIPKNTFLLYEVDSLIYGSYCKTCSDKKLTERSTKPDTKKQLSEAFK